jgi:hypothetical protein
VDDGTWATPSPSADKRGLTCGNHFWAISFLQHVKKEDLQVKEETWDNSIYFSIFKKED